MQASALPTSLSKVPWVTWGRRESSRQFWTNIEKQRQAWKYFAVQPTFAFQVRGEYGSAEIQTLIDSLKAQSYPFWKLELRANNEFASDDPRVVSGGVWADYLGKLEAGWILSPALLYQAVAELQAGSARVIYWNEARLNSKGTQIESLIYRKEFSDDELSKFNGMGKAFLEGSSSEPDRSLVFIPQFLIYRKTTEPAFEMISRSTSSDELLEETVVSAIVCYRDYSKETIRALESLSKQTKRASIELILVNNDSKTSENDLVLKRARSLFFKVKTLDFPGAFNFARMNNEAIRKLASGSLILLLNNDVELQGTGCVDTMAAEAMRPETGTVGVQLRYPDGRLQQAGLGVHEGGKHRLFRLGNSTGDEAIAGLDREVFANGFALCIFRRGLFDEVGGLDETQLQNGFGDADFSFKLRRLGKRNICLGSLIAFHQEGASRGRTYEFWEEREIEERYPEILQQMLRRDLRVVKVSRWESFKENLRLALRDLVDARSS